MSSRTLNPAPTLRQAAAAQLRMVALLQRRDFAILGAVLAGLTALSVWGYATMPPQTFDEAPQVFPIFPTVALLLLGLGALWPLSVWRLDDRARRGYFWSMPVEQGLHTLLRVFAGWLTLMGACAAIALLGILVTGPMAAQYEEVRLGFAGAWIPFVIPTLPYLFVSAVVIAFEHPLRVAVGIWLAFLGVAIVIEAVNTDTVSELVNPVAKSAAIALTNPIVIPLDGDYFRGSWGLNFGLWFALTVILLVAGSFRRDDVA